jgi:Protein of unknown function (DUF4232)
MAMVATLGALTLLLAACGGGGSPSASTTSTTSSSGTSSTTTTTTQPTLAACKTGQLSVTAGMSSGAAGTIGQVVLFENVSSTLCLFHAFPGVAGLDANGNQLTQATRILGNGTPFTGSAASLPTIQLAPGATASALVEGSDVPTGNATSCVSYPALLVTPPNALQSVKVVATLPGCSGLRVTPVVAGTAGM